jgi:hypothetical protein
MFLYSALLILFLYVEVSIPWGGLPHSSIILKHNIYVENWIYSS